jgi:hypothetical protein
MDVVKCGELYCKLDFQLFLWDTTWEIWRPISAVGWDGYQITFDDRQYKKDIFDSAYGFGSEEMKELCQKLTEFVDRTKYSEDVHKLFSKAEFFFDRKLELLPSCTNLRTKESWKKYLQYSGSTSRTLRKYVDCRKTRRLHIGLNKK